MGAFTCSGKGAQGFNENLPTLMKQADQVNLYDSTGKVHVKLATKAGPGKAIEFANRECKYVIEARGKQEMQTVGKEEQP